MNTSRRNWIRLATAAQIGGSAWSVGARLDADDGPNSSLFSGRLRATPVSTRQPGLSAAPPPTTSWYEVPLPPTSYLENLINTQRDFVQGSGDQGIARAIDQVKIDVIIPASYADNPALFVSLLLDTRTYPPKSDTKVIINERKQAIIVGVDVEIGPVAVMHKNRLIQTGDQSFNEFVAVDPSQDIAKPKLTTLVDALNALKVPAADAIDIIKMLKHKRAL